MADACPVNLSIVIPVYRSEQSLPILLDRLSSVLQNIPGRHEIICIDDCSPDRSWETLKQLKGQYGSLLRIVRLLNNSGQHSAILCGFGLACGRIVITMDDDLQNPPEEIPRLIERIDQGFDLAIGAYDSKKHSAARNYGGDMIDRLLRQIFKLPADFQLTSFRAIRQPVVRAAAGMGGAFPYITAMLLANTTRYVNVPVRHDARQFGRSNYNLKRSVRLAANLILAYSDYPLKAIAFACFLSFFLAVAYGSFVFGQALLYGSSVSGWASMIVVVSFFNGIVLLCLAVLALYISRMHRQVTGAVRTSTIGEIHG